MRKHLEADEDYFEPTEWRRLRSLEDEKKKPAPAYRQRRVVQATPQEYAKRQPVYRIPQRPYFMRHHDAQPARYGTDAEGRLYIWVAEKLPFGEGVDEAAAFFQRKDYSSAQRALYVILPAKGPAEYPERDTLTVTWPGEARARRYSIFHADFENKRAVGVAVVAERLL